MLQVYVADTCMFDVTRITDAPDSPDEHQMTVEGIEPSLAYP